MKKLIQMLMYQIDLRTIFINTRRRDIHSYFTRDSKNLFIVEIRLQGAKPVFYYKGASIFNS